MTSGCGHVRRYADQAARVRDWVADSAEAICLVPAPPFKEERRAEFVAERFRSLGYAPRTDEVGNVVVRRSGRGEAPAILLMGHTDTVFPEGTEITVSRGEGTLTGPGIGDNSLGVASLLGLARSLDELDLRTAGDLILAANVGEEGLGNLRGARHVVDSHRDELGAAIAIEGHSLGRVTTGAVGSKRIKVMVTGPGGHSWGAFGQPSAIHELGHIIHEIDSLQVAADPKTTYNVGVIDGGVSVNTIAPRASAVVDMRSVDVECLESLATQVDAIIQNRNSDQIATEIKVLGERPAGETPLESPIVTSALSILRDLGLEPYTDASSTDANIPISRGIPAVCVGITRGEGSHRIDETIQIEPITIGLTQLLMLVMAFPFEDGPS